jgi:hypothetical protein
MSVLYAFCLICAKWWSLVLMFADSKDHSYNREGEVSIVQG